MKRLNFGGIGVGSPEVHVNPKDKDEGKEKSLADIADNWRSRANENGIRVSSGEGDGDDDADDEGAFMVVFYIHLCLGC